MKLNVRIITATLFFMLSLSCFASAEEIMGRCVGFDKGKNQIRIIRDMNNDKAKPDFQLPIQTFTIPENTVVKDGLRIKLDLQDNKLKYYDEATDAIKVLDFQLISKKENVLPLDKEVVGEKFPAIDKAKKTVTIYSKRQKLLTVISVQDEVLELPLKVFDSGDDVKITTVEPGKAAKIDK